MHKKELEPKAEKRTGAHGQWGPIGPGSFFGLGILFFSAFASRPAFGFWQNPYFKGACLGMCLRLLCTCTTISRPGNVRGHRADLTFALMNKSKKITIFTRTARNNCN